MLLNKHLAEEVIRYGIHAGHSPGQIAELLNQAGIIEDGLRNEDQMDEDGEIQIHSGISAFPASGTVWDAATGRPDWPDEARSRALALLTAAYYAGDLHG